MSLSPGSRVGPYEVVAPIGAGGMGTVSPESAVLPITLGAFDGGYSYSALGHLLAFLPAGSDLKRRLAWYDRTGRSAGEIAVPANTQGVEIAPDASRAVFEVFEAGLSSRDLWVATLATGATQKVAFTDADEADAKWMPDSRTIVFGPRRDGAGPLVRLVLDSTEPAVPLEGFEAEEPQYPSSLSREGGVLAFMRGGSPFWMRLPRSKPEPLQGVAAATARPRVSPDGRWLLYEGVSAGRREVYLQPLPPTGARWPVSRRASRSLRGAVCTPTTTSRRMAGSSSSRTSTQRKPDRRFASSSTGSRCCLRRDEARVAGLSRR